MQRLFPVVSACLFSFLLSDTARACPIDPPDREALVDVGLSSIRLPLQVGLYGEPEIRRCTAWLALPLSALPSRSVVPRPRELARPLAPVAKVFGARNCAIAVWVNDDADDGIDSIDTCYRGEFRFDGDAWSTVEDDSPCW